tara:strand:+ start:23994 stop:24629 length:636 start_codon:yes stop_codon:yes gene_type:complete
MKDLIVISGNIGAGKSTFLDFFVKNLQEKTIKDVILVEEGIESDPIFKEKLEAFYENPNTRIDFQQYITNFRHKRLQEYPDNSILVSERGLMDDVVFSNATSLDLETPEGDYIKYYYDLIDRLKNDYPKVLANIYLKTDPQKCMENIRKRNRKGETEIDQLYLNTLHNMHEGLLPKMAEMFQYPLIIENYHNDKCHNELFNDIYKKIKNIL